MWNLEKHLLSPLLHFDECLPISMFSAAFYPHCEKVFVFNLKHKHIEMLVAISAF